MIATFVRIILGFLVACLVAAITQVLFVITPADLYSLGGEARMERIGFAWLVALSAATQAAIFAGPFALVAIGIGLMAGLRGWAYYVFVGLAIALAGFVVLYAGENSGQPTIANSYAVAAFAFSGIIAGYVYWLIAGYKAGGNYQPERPGPLDPEDDGVTREHLKVKDSTLAEDIPSNRARRASTAEAVGVAPSNGKLH